MKKPVLIISEVIVVLGMLAIPDFFGQACVDPLGGYPLPPAYTYSLCVPGPLKYGAVFVAVLLVFGIAWFTMKIKDWRMYVLIFLVGFILSAVDVWLHGSSVFYY